MAKKFVTGFTLIELIIVITILGLLAIFAIVFLKNQLYKGNDAKRKSDLSRIKVAVEEYEKDHNCYPLYINTCGVDTNNLIYPYLNNIPCDPVSGLPYVYEHDGSNSCPKWFRTYTLLQYLKDLSITLGIGPSGHNNFNYYISSPNAPILVGSTSTPGPTVGPTSPPVYPGDYYGCLSGVCTLITWDVEIPGPGCNPTYQNSTCYGQCVNPQNECVNIH